MVWSLSGYHVNLQGASTQGVYGLKGKVQRGGSTQGLSIGARAEGSVHTDHTGFTGQWAPEGHHHLNQPMPLCNQAKWCYSWHQTQIEITPDIWLSNAIHPKIICICRIQCQDTWFLFHSTLSWCCLKQDKKDALVRGKKSWPD